MRIRSTSLPRRRFLEIGSATLVAAAVGTMADRAAAQAKLPPLDEKDAQAQALGYRSDSTKVDKAKYPKHAATQMCGTCALFMGKAGDATGGCAIFAGKAVNAKGWCSAWAKKA